MSMLHFKLLFGSFTTFVSEVEWAGLMELRCCILKASETAALSGSCSEAHSRLPYGLRNQLSRNLRKRVNSQRFVDHRSFTAIAGSKHVRNCTACKRDWCKHSDRYQRVAASRTDKHAISIRAVVVVESAVQKFPYKWAVCIVHRYASLCIVRIFLTRVIGFCKFKTSNTSQLVGKRSVS